MVVNKADTTNSEIIFLRVPAPHAVCHTCVAFDSLKRWQIKQYLWAVNENKWYLSERFGRDVGWCEAEQDFTEHDFYGLAAQWRLEFCAHFCEYGQRCSLKERFKAAA